MAANMNNHQDASVIIDRIKKLTPDSTRQWGQMSLVQMLQHCGMQLKLGLGEVPQANHEGPGFFRTSLGRWLILYLLPWPKGTSTPQQMDMLKNKLPPQAVEQAKQNLIHLLERAQAQANLSPHPLFGKLNKRQWGRLIWKHLDHHLKQFGT